MFGKIPFDAVAKKNEQRWAKDEYPDVDYRDLAQSITKLRNEHLKVN